jgi:hypothetical protein
MIALWETYQTKEGTINAPRGLKEYNVPEITESSKRW